MRDELDCIREQVESLGNTRNEDRTHRAAGHSRRPPSADGYHSIIAADGFNICCRACGRDRASFHVYDLVVFCYGCCPVCRKGAK